MKKKIIILICIMIFVKGNSNLKAEEINSLYTLDLEGVSDTFEYVRTSNILGGEALVYEDAYMGNLIITNYKDVHTGYIYSIFGNYRLEVSDTFEITGIHRQTSGNDTASPIPNKYSFADLEIIKNKVDINHEYIKNNQVTGSEITISFVYNEEFLVNSGISIDELYTYIIGSVGAMEQTFLNSGLNYNINVLEPYKTTYNGSIKDDMFSQSPEVYDVLNYIDQSNTDYTYYLGGTKSQKATTLLIKAMDSSNSLGEESILKNISRASSLTHEFGHALGLGHDVNNAPPSYYEKQPVGYRFGVEQMPPGPTIGTIMAYSTNRILYFSSDKLLEPSTNDKYLSNPNFVSSLEFLKEPLPDYENRLEEVSQYGETYNDFPRIDISDKDSNFDTGFMIDYQAKDEFDSGYSDLKWYDESVAIEIVEEKTTYKPGGTGREYDTLVLKVTNLKGNSKYYTRYIKNIS